MRDIAHAIVHNIIHNILHDIVRNHISLRDNLQKCVIIFPLYHEWINNSPSFRELKVNKKRTPSNENVRVYRLSPKIIILGGSDYLSPQISVYTAYAGVPCSTLRVDLLGCSCFTTSPFGL